MECWFLDDDVGFPVVVRQGGKDAGLLRLPEGVTGAVVDGGGGVAPRLGIVVGIEDVVLVELVSSGGGRRRRDGHVGGRRREDTNKSVGGRRSPVAIADDTVLVHFQHSETGDVTVSNDNLKGTDDVLH